MDSFPALKTHVVSANGSYSREVRSGGAPSALGSGSKDVPRADSKSCGTNVHGSGAKAGLEPSSDDVQCSGSNSCSAALSSVDSFSYGEDGLHDMPGGRSPPKDQLDGGAKSGHDSSSKELARIEEIACDDEARVDEACRLCCS